MHRQILGCLALLSVDLIWVLSSELTKYLFTKESFDKPFFTVFVKTTLFMTFLIKQLFKNSHDYSLLETVEEGSTDSDEPEESLLSPPAFVPINYEPEHDDDEQAVRFSRVAEVRVLSTNCANSAQLSRMSYQASQLLHEQNLRNANAMGIKETANVALSFCLLWLLANTTYQLALSYSQVALVNVLSSSSSLFALFLSAICSSSHDDKFTLSKLFCVLISISGVILISDELSFDYGGLFALLSAFFYASYIVFLRKRVGDSSRMDVFLFFGFVGLFNLILLWPIFVILNYTGIELFQWPNGRQWAFLIANGIIGTLLSEVLWVWGTLLTSSLASTLSISLTIPLSMLVDVVMKNISYPMTFYLGSVPILLSFVFVSLLSYWDNWDPVQLAICFLFGITN